MHVEDVNGDGKLDILMGDNGMVGGGGVRPDLSREERTEYQGLLEERAAVAAHFREARKPWDTQYAKALKDAGKLSEMDRVLLQRELVRDKMEKNEDYQRLKEIAAERGHYEQPYIRRGFVWLFTHR